MFAVAVMLLAGMAAGQAMLVGGVSSEPTTLSQSVSPYELMQNARNLAVETVENLV
jgi:hypothetical protein